MFIKVHDDEDGEPTYINPDYIVEICVENGITEITLGVDSYLTIKENICDVMRAIGYRIVGTTNGDTPIRRYFDRRRKKREIRYNL